MYDTYHVEWYNTYDWYLLATHNLTKVHILKVSKKLTLLKPSRSKDDACDNDDKHTHTHLFLSFFSSCRLFFLTFYPSLPWSLFLVSFFRERTIVPELYCHTNNVWIYYKIIRSKKTFFLFYPTTDMGMWNWDFQMFHQYESEWSFLLDTVYTCPLYPVDTPTDGLDTLWSKGDISNILPTT